VHHLVRVFILHLLPRYLRLLLDGPIECGWGYGVVVGLGLGLTITIIIITITITIIIIIIIITTAYLLMTIIISSLLKNLGGPI
jgi:hypothetical protein